MSNAYNTHARAFQNDSKGGSISNNNTVRQEKGGSPTKFYLKWDLKMKQQKNPWPWYIHQLKAHTKPSACKYQGCHVGNKYTQ